MLNIKKLLAQMLNAVKVDFLVEQGTDGIWAYRKWNSGIAECWGFKTVSGSFSEWGEWYTFSTAGEDYPTDLFNTAPFAVGQLRCAVAYDSIGGCSYGSSATTAPKVICGRPTALSGQYSFVAHWYAKGTWK